MGKLIDLSGKKFGRYTVLYRDNRQHSVKNAFWICRCECGNIRSVNSNCLRRGGTTSCGCYRSEYFRKKMTKHGDSATRLGRVWYGIKERCYNKNDPAYKNYGGRGIKVCDEWKDFEVFEKWAYESGFKEGLTLDRIDVNGDYEPSNCRWITHKEQQSNRRDNVYITFNGERRTVQQWSEITGIKKSTIQRRMKLGWDEKDLLKPVDKTYSHSKGIKESWDRRKENPRTEITIESIENQEV